MFGILVSQSSLTLKQEQLDIIHARCAAIGGNKYGGVRFSFILTF